MICVRCRISVHSGSSLRCGLPGDDSRRFELNSALEIALNEPEALERWVGGEDVLAPARAAGHQAD